MKKAKLFCIGVVLASIVAVTAVYAGGNRESSSAGSDGLTTLRVWGRNRQHIQGSTNASLQDWVDKKVPSRLYDTFVQKLADLGLKFEMTLVMEDQYPTAFQTLRASGQFNNYDIVYGHALDLQTLYSLVDQNRIVALDQAIEQYSDGTARTFFSEGNGAEMKGLFTMSNGSFYWIPGMYQLSYKGIPMGGISLGAIRTDWLDRLNLSMPQSADEFYNVLMQFRQQDVNRNGVNDEVADVNIASFDNGVAQLFGIATDHEGEGLHYLAYTDNGLQCAWYQPGVKSYFAFMNRLYGAGLLRTGAEPTDQMENKIGFIRTWFPTTVEIGIRVPEGEPGAYYMPLLFSAYQGIQPPIWNVGGLSIGTDKVMMVPAASKNIAATIKFIDWYVTNDFFTLMEPGIEGYTFNYDDNGIPMRFKDQNQIGIDGDIGSGLWAEGIVPWVQIRDAYGSTQATVAMGTNVGYAEGWTGKGTFMDDLVLNHPYPYSYYTGGILAQATDEEKNRLTVLLPDLNTYISELSSALVMGEKGLDNDSWNGYLADLKRLGLDEIISIWQARIDRADN